MLASVLRRGAHRTLGFPTREGYVGERLRLDPSWGRALLRIERAAQVSPAFARAYRSGAITALQAASLVPLVVADLAEVWVQRWVEIAQGFTLRRLRVDVEKALLLYELDFEAWRRTGGLPEIEVRDAWKGGGEEREIGADCTQPESSADPAHEGTGREIGAGTTPVESCTVRLIVDAEVAQLWRALLCSVRRRSRPVDGRLPTAGQALGVILDHVLDTWGALDRKVRRAHRVFARDGWRCVVPGCSSMRNLHDHHVVFRSAGGSDALENRVTLCAFHHLRGVHAGTVRCLGRAPGALRFELGVRTGREPLAAYGAGDRVIGGVGSSYAMV